MVLNHNVSVLLSQWTLSLLMMTTEAAPLANLTTPLDLCLDFQLACRVNTSLGARGGACGMVKTAKKNWWTCLRASWFKYGGNDAVEGRTEVDEKHAHVGAFSVQMEQDYVEGQSFCVAHEWRAALKKRELWLTSQSSLLWWKWVQ